METNENLEIHFSVNPRLEISIKLIAAYGRGVTQKTFVNESCPAPWLNTLNDIAAAIKREASPQDANASGPYHNTPSETSSTHSPPATDQVNSTSLEHRSLINNAPMLASPYTFTTPNNFYGDGQAAGGFFSDSVSPPSSSSNNCASSRNTPEPPSSVMLQTASLNGLDMFSVEQQLHMSLLYRSPMDDFYPSGPPTFSAITPPRTTPISSRQSPEFESTAASPTHRRAHSFPTSSGTEFEGAIPFQGNASIEVEMSDPSSTEYYRSNTAREFSYFTSTPRSKLMRGDAMDSRDQALRERLRKLEILLKEVEEQPIPSPRDHSEKVLRLTSNQDSPLDDTPMSAEEFGQLLSRLGNVYSSAGVVYSLLSWEIYRWEEERLTQKENLPEIVAAKRVSKKPVLRSHTTPNSTIDQRQDVRIHNSPHPIQGLGK